MLPQSRRQQSNMFKEVINVDWAQEKILITGGTGFLGANLTRHLIAKKQVQPENIRIFYLENTPTNALDGINGLEMRPGNMLNKDQVKEVCKDVSIVFHTAASTTFEPKAKKIQWLINVEGTRNLLDIAKKSNTIKRICYTSTINTLGAPNPFGSIGTIETSNQYTNKPKVHSFNSSKEALEFADMVHEGTAPKKWWKQIEIGYHDSKLAAQELVNRAVEKENLDIVSVLPGTFFGPFDVFIGPSVYLLQIYNNRMPGVLKTGFPVVHVDDVVNGHFLAIEKGKKGERYIITGFEEDNRYLKDMAKIIAEVIQEKEPDRKIKKKFSTFPFFLANFAASLSELYAKLFKKPCLLSKAAVKAASFPNFYSYDKAQRDLGYIPQKTFRQGVEDTYDFMKKNQLFERKGREMDKIFIKKP